MREQMKARLMREQKVPDLCVNTEAYTHPKLSSSGSVELSPNPKP